MECTAVLNAERLHSLGFHITLVASTAPEGKLTLTMPYYAPGWRWTNHMQQPRGKPEFLGFPWSVELTASISHLSQLRNKRSDIEYRDA